MAKFRLAVATALAVLASGSAPEECAAGAGRCAAAAASVSDSTRMLQVPPHKHKGRGPQGDKPNVALLGDDKGKDRGLSTTRGCPYGVEMWRDLYACESYSSARHVGGGGSGSHKVASQALKCAPYCSGRFSIGESGDCRCCHGSYSTGLKAWATWECKPAPPPVPCKMGTWSAWGACSESCGAGTRSRSRSVISQPRNGGKACENTEDEEPCNAKPCPVDCKLGDWGGWGACSATCGSGKRSRSRTETTSAAHGGKACENTEDEEDCSDKPCPVDCKLSDWGGWGACSETCGSGKRSRSRTETTSAAHGGKACQKTEDEEDCSDKLCPAVSEAAPTTTTTTTTAPTTTTTTTTKGRCVCKNYECRESQFLAGDGGFESDCASATGDGTSPIACNALRNIARKSFCDWQ